MYGLEKLGLLDTSRLQTILRQYRQYGRIYVTVDRVEDGTAYLTAHQQPLAHQPVLSRDELQKRVAEAFDGETPLKIAFNEAS